MKTRIFFVSFACMLLLGCAIQVWTHRIEIENYSIKKVKRATIASVIESSYPHFPLNKRWSVGDFIAVQISTDKDIAKLSREHSLNFSVEAWFCTQPTKVVDLGMPHLFIEGKSVLAWDVIAATTGKVPKAIDRPIFDYDIVLHQEWLQDSEISDALKKDKKQVYYLKYDLKENPQDICISLAGGSMTQGIKSNEIIIPAAEIERVLK